MDAPSIFASHWLNDANHVELLVVHLVRWDQRATVGVQGKVGKTRDGRSRPPERTSANSNASDSIAAC